MFAKLVLVAASLLATTEPPKSEKPPTVPTFRSIRDRESPPHAEPGPFPGASGASLAVDPAPPPRTESLKRAEFSPAAPTETARTPLTAPKLFETPAPPPPPKPAPAVTPAPPPAKPKPKPVSPTPAPAAVGLCARDCSEGCSCTPGRACRGSDCQATVKTVAVQNGEQAGHAYSWIDTKDYPGYQMYGYIDPADGMITSYENPPRYRRKPAPPQSLGLQPAPVMSIPVPIEHYAVPGPAPVYYAPQFSYPFPGFYGGGCATGNCPAR